jgi:hypothetical protein
MGDRKKIAVIVRDRKAEALRVICGLTLLDDFVDVFILDRGLDRNAPEMKIQLETIKELGLNMYSNVEENGCATMSLDVMANKLLEYDIVLPY